MSAIVKLRDYYIASVLAGTSAVLVIPIALSARILHPDYLGAISIPFIIGIILIANCGLLLASKLSPYVPHIQRFVRFATVGVFNTVCDTSIIMTLAYLMGIYKGWPIILFNTVSFSITMIASYFINRSWSFESPIPPSRREFVSFTAVLLSSLVVNTIFVYGFTTFISPSPMVEPTQWLTLAKLGGVCLSFLWNFFWLHLYVFQHRANIIFDR
jgi:putative flippase GtrA